MLKNLLLAGLGGSIGSMLRFSVYVLFGTSHFPLATLLINIAGSLALGMLLGYGFRDITAEGSWKAFLSTGICGGFTTFSAFSVENLQMLQQGKYFISFFYIAISIIGGIIAAWIGFKITSV